MLGDLRQTTTRVLAHIELQTDAEQPFMAAQSAGPTMLQEEHLDPATGQNEMMEEDYAMAGEVNGMPPPRPARTRQAATTQDPDNPLTWGKVSRNAACPCGSGKKYKHCHGN
jgi:preprotein translocase subunit SecA